MFNIYMRRNSEVPYTAPAANLPAENREVLERSSMIDAQADMTQGSVAPAASQADAATKPRVEYGKTSNYS